MRTAVRRAARKSVAKEGNRPSSAPGSAGAGCGEPTSIFARGGTPQGTSARKTSQSSDMQCSSPESIRIQVREFRQHEQPVLANELVVEPDLTAAVVRALDADHVPVALALVAVAVDVVRLAGGEVEAAGDLFVEEDVLHRPQDVGVERDGELADVAPAGV